MQKWHTNIFTGGLNTDDDPLLLPEGDYIAASNISNNENGYMNVMRTLRGNAPFTNQVGLAFGSIPIGGCEYPAINGFIVFYYSAIGQHSIWQYSSLSNLWTKILESPVLDFKESNYIGKNCKIFGNDLLVWADGYFDNFLNNFLGYPRYHDVRSISISKAIGGGYTTLSSNILNLAKMPPIPPSVTYVDDANLSINNLYRNQFKFRVQFVYDNEEDSSWSAITQLAYQNGYEFWNGKESSQYLNNTIEVSVPTGSYIVKGIRVAASVNGGPFGIFEELDKAAYGIADDTFYTVVFTNSKSVLPVSDSVPNYYDVPQAAATIEAMPSGVLAFGNYYREFDLIVPDVDMGYEITEITTTNRFTPGINVETFSTGRRFKSVPNNALPYMEGDVITIIAMHTSGNYSFSRAVQAGDFGSGTDLQKHRSVINAFVTAYNASAPPVNAVMVGLTNPWFDIVPCGANTKIYVNRPSYAVPTLKTGTKRQFGIKYLDAVNRESAVITDAVTMNLNILNPPEEDTSTFSNPNNPYFVQAQMEINHTPPPWAKYWCVVSKDDGGMQSFMQVSAFEVLNDPLVPSMVRITISQAYTNSFQGATYNHEIQVGDQVRFRTKSVQNSLTPNSYHSKVSETITLTVRKYDPVGGFQSNPAIWVDIFEWPDLLNNTGNLTGTGALLEIFRPFPASENNPWYEIGEWQNVRFAHTANRAHEGNIQNQTSVLPAIQLMRFSDAWIRCRPMGVAIGSPPGMTWASYFVEDTRMSDYWDSDLTSRGRLAFYDINAKRVYLESAINHSFPFIQDTKVNGLNQISLLTEKNLNSNYGAVTALTISANTLVVNQERHSCAVYTDSVLAANPGAGDTVLATPIAFATVRYYEYLAGCIDPHTVIYENGSVFWLDRVGGQVIENAGGGLIPITKGSYKYNAGGIGIAAAVEFADLTYGYYNRQYNEYVIAVMNTSQSTSWVGTQYVFSRLKRRWIRHETYPMAWALSFQSRTIGFNHLDGEAYDQDGANAANEYFGIVYPYTLAFAVNPEPTVNKQFLSMGIKGNEIMPITIDGVGAGSNLPNNVGQMTQFNENWFELIEGTYWAPIPCDETTPNFPSVDEARLNGNPIEGMYLSVGIQGTPTIVQFINFVRTGYFVRAPKL